ncbi:hypothetical protein [Lutibacter sp.]
MEIIAIKRNIILLFSTIVISTFISSCRKGVETNSDVNEIVTLLIKTSVKQDQFYNSENKNFKKDFFINGKFILAYYWDMDPISNSVNLRKNKNEFEKTFKLLRSLSEPIKLELKEGNIFDNVWLRKLTPELIEEFSNERHLKSFHNAILFSRIAINESRNKALIVFSNAISPLSSVSYLYYLKKEKGIWNIIDRQLLSIS